MSAPGYVHSSCITNMACMAWPCPRDQIRPCLLNCTEGKSPATMPLVISELPFSCVPRMISISMTRQTRPRDGGRPPSRLRCRLFSKSWQPSPGFSRLFLPSNIFNVLFTSIADRYNLGDALNAALLDSAADALLRLTQQYG